MKFNKIFSVVTNVFIVFLVVYAVACSWAAMSIEDKASIEYLKMVMYSHQSFMEAFALMVLEMLSTIYKVIGKLISIWNQLLALSPDQSSSEEHSKECKQEE